MILYIMRHAEAVAAIDTLPDQWRFLTEAGRTASKKVCTAVARYGPKTRLIVTSPLTRAVQTAEIAAGVACRRNRVIASELLLPGTDVTALKTFLRQQHEKQP